MSKQLVYGTICLTLIVLLFDGCRKFDFHDAAKRCKIMETDFRIITYDEWGNPTQAVFKEDPDATGNPTFHFQYNNKHQLIGYSGFNEHHLTLNANGQAVRDTMIMNYGGQDDRYARQISYDLYGRIVRITSEHYHSGMEELTPPFQRDTSYFVYDRRGNKIVKGIDQQGNEFTFPYDFKTSIYRTHPVFMFVNNDYSRNNMLFSDVQYQYNDAGLPINFRGPFLEFSGGNGTFVYECGESGLK
jgi:hypothetical protein